MTSCRARFGIVSDFPWQLRTLVVCALLLTPLISWLIVFPATGQARTDPRPNLLINGNFEQGFTYQRGCGHVGAGWGCFTNSGQTLYGFYDEQWPPVVLEGRHSQLIELNTKNLGIADDDRFAGIYQTVEVQPGEVYEFNIRGMIRVDQSVDATGDPWRYRVQVGRSFGPTPDWQSVGAWFDTSWNRYHERLAPGRFESFMTKFIAQGPTVTIYIRVWKKWGNIDEEINVNLDRISLFLSSYDTMVVPTLTATPIPPNAPPPLLLNGGTPVASLPTPPSLFGQSYLPPANLRAPRGWPRLDGAYVSFSYPSSWQPTLNTLGGNAVGEEFRLGIRNVPDEQVLGFSRIPFGDLRPLDAVQTSQITIGGREGVKWLRQGPTYVIHEYCTRGLDNAGSFCVRVSLTTSNPMIEVQLERLVQSIVFH